MALSMSVGLSMLFSDVTATVSTGIAMGSDVESTFIIEFGEGGGMDPSLSIPLQNGGPVTSATLRISTVDGSIDPERVFVDVGLDGRLDWSFGGGSQGHFGKQVAFSDGSVGSRVVLDQTGSAYSIFVPMDAVIESAVLNISSPPSPEGMPIREVYPLGTDLPSIDSVDAADVDGDGIDELFFHSPSDETIYAVIDPSSQSPEMVPLVKGILSPVSLRAIPKTSSTDGGFIFSAPRSDGSAAEVRIGTGVLVENMSTALVSEDLPQGSIGFGLRRGENGRDHSIKVISGAQGGILDVSIQTGGVIMTKKVLDSSGPRGGIAEVDLDGDGDLDLVLFPERPDDGNLTVYLMENEGDKTEYDMFQGPSGHILAGSGAPVDSDADGAEELYVPIDDGWDIAVITMEDASLGPSLSWTGLNDTYSSPRTLPHYIYGSGGAYTGGEGLVYLAGMDGLVHLAPVRDPQDNHVWRKSTSFQGLSVIGSVDGSGTGAIYSIDKGSGLASSTLTWTAEEYVWISRSDGTSSKVFDLSGQGKDTVDLSFILGASSPPKNVDKYGNVMERFDLRAKGGGGLISFSDLVIDYDITLECAGTFSFLEALSRAQAVFGEDRIPFSVGSASEGSVEIGPAVVEYDSPPMFLSTLPERIEIAEGAMDKSLMDIKDLVKDDMAEPSDLKVRLITSDDMPEGLLSIEGDGFLFSHTNHHPDLWGDFKFWLEISDLRSTVTSAGITLSIFPVNDVPVIFGDLSPIEISEGASTSIPMYGEDGVFADPDGDQLFFRWKVKDAYPADLGTYLDIREVDGCLNIAPDRRGSGGTFKLELTAYDTYMMPDDGPVAAIGISVTDVDSPPTIGTNPGTIRVREDQDTPTKVPLEGWIVDSDTPISFYSYSVISSNPRLEVNISSIGGRPYLILLPTRDLTGPINVWLEVNGPNVTIVDKVIVEVEAINDLPEVTIEGRRLLENRGWLISGSVLDPDDEGGRVEYKIGSGDWMDGWGFTTWSFVIDFTEVPVSGGFISIRAYDGEEYSSQIYIKLVPPMTVPDAPPQEGDDDEPDDDDDEEPDDLYNTPADSGDGPFPWLLTAGVVGGLLSLIAFFGWTEIGFVLIATLSMTLYSKLSRKDILNHEVRGLIRGYIIANPGDHYSSIKRNLDLNNGTLAYHLRVLEQSGFIKSMFDGIYKRYYPSNVNISKLKRNVSKQEEIFNMILEHPGITMEQIGQLIGVSRQVVNYHVKNLIRTGVITYERDQKSAKFYPSEPSAIGKENF